MSHSCRLQGMRQDNEIATPCMVHMVGTDDASYVAVIVVHSTRHHPCSLHHRTTSHDALGIHEDCNVSFMDTLCRLYTLHLCTHACLAVHAYICACINVCMCMYVCLQRNMYPFIYIYKNRYLYICIQTHIHNVHAHLGFDGRLNSGVDVHLYLARHGCTWLMTGYPRYRTHFIPGMCSCQVFFVLGLVYILASTTIIVTMQVPYKCGQYYPCKAVLQITQPSHLQQTGSVLQGSPSQNKTTMGQVEQTEDAIWTHVFCLKWSLW